MAWPHPRLIAHRGGGALAPENTLAGLRTAASLGYRGVEFDVMLSADGTPVLIHDETLERTTDGRGRVADASDAELARLDAGSWHGEQFAGEPLPSFGDAAELCLALGLWANVEIKPSAGREAETGRKVAQAARELWAGAAPPLLSSFSLEALAAARDAAPELPRGCCSSRRRPAGGKPCSAWAASPCTAAAATSARRCSPKRGRRASRCCSTPSTIRKRPPNCCVRAWRRSSRTAST